MMQQEMKTRCAHLRRLREQMEKEIRALQVTLRETESRGFDNPIETVEALQSLQHAYNKIETALAECPEDDV